MTVKDQLHRTLTFSETPKRVISLVPSQTELLIDLGLRNRVVGVTKFCVHPKDLRKKTTVVGGTKTIHLEKIIALQPDLIICNKEENTQDIVASCEKIAPVWVSDIKDIAGNNDMIVQLGAILGVEEKAKKLVEKINQAAEKFSIELNNNKKPKVAYLIWKEPYMAVGQDTFIDHLLTLNGFENFYKFKEGRYPQLELEELKGADAILLSSEPYPFKNKDRTALKNALNKPVYLVDGEYFSWYGSRLLKAFSYFSTLNIN